MSRDSRRESRSGAGGADLSVIICTLDEHEAIGGVIRELRGALAGVRLDLVVVDDSADERTADAARAAAPPGQVRVIRRNERRGLASAAIAGWDAARGELLAVMDGDGQHDPARLAELYRRMIAEPDADIGVASRYVTAEGTGLTGGRNLISRAGTLLTGLLLGVRTTDPLSGLFVMRRRWFEAARPRLSGVGFKILVDVMASGPRRPEVVEVPTALRPRAGGRSKLDFRIMAELAALLLEKRTGGLVSSQFTLFMAVGLTGVAAHLLTLDLALRLGARFWEGQAVAILLAMTSNFLLNNALTFRDRRLRGLRALRGLLIFYGGCSAGAAVNEAVASALRALGAAWPAAALVGVATGAVLNYWVAKQATWRAGAACALPTGEGEAAPLLQPELAKGPDAL